MNQTVVGHVQFVDEVTHKNDYIMVRVVEGHIGVSFVIEGDGDIDVDLPRSTCEMLIEWLQKALEESGKNENEPSIKLPRIVWGLHLPRDVVPNYLKEVLRNQSVMGAMQFEGEYAEEYAFSIVRISSGNIGITLYQESSGDVEVFPPRSVCEEFIEWLRNALEEISSHKGNKIAMK